MHIAGLPWLVVVSATHRARVQELCADLDQGEAVTGLLGVVAQAKRAGAIDAAKPILDELIQTARFWIAPGLYREVLAQLGESLQLP